MAMHQRRHPNEAPNNPFSRGGRRMTYTGDPRYGPQQVKYKGGRSVFSKVFLAVSVMLLGYGAYSWSSGPAPPPPKSQLSELEAKIKTEPPSKSSRSDFNSQKSSLSKKEPPSYQKLGMRPVQTTKHKAEEDMGESKSEDALPYHAASKDGDESELPDFPKESHDEENEKTAGEEKPSGSDHEEGEDEEQLESDDKSGKKAVTRVDDQPGGDSRDPKGGGQTLAEGNDGGELLLDKSHTFKGGDPPGDGVAQEATTGDEGTKQDIIDPQSADDTASVKQSEIKTTEGTAGTEGTKQGAKKILESGEKTLADPSKTSPRSGETKDTPGGAELPKDDPARVGNEEANSQEGGEEAAIGTERASGEDQKVKEDVNENEPDEAGSGEENTEEETEETDKAGNKDSGGTDENENESDEEASAEENEEDEETGEAGEQETVATDETENESDEEASGEENEAEEAEETGEAGEKESEATDENENESDEEASVEDNEEEEAEETGEAGEKDSEATGENEKEPDEEGSGEENEEEDAGETGEAGEKDSEAIGEEENEPDEAGSGETTTEEKTEETGEAGDKDNGDTDEDENEPDEEASGEENTQREGKEAKENGDKVSGVLNEKASVEENTEEEDEETGKVGDQASGGTKKPNKKLASKDSDGQHVQLQANSADVLIDGESRKANATSPTSPTTKANSAMAADLASNSTTSGARSAHLHGVETVKTSKVNRPAVFTVEAGEIIDGKEPETMSKGVQSKHARGKTGGTLIKPDGDDHGKPDRSDLIAPIVEVTTNSKSNSSNPDETFAHRDKSKILQGTEALMDKAPVNDMTADEDSKTTEKAVPASKKVGKLRSVGKKVVNISRTTIKNASSEPLETPQVSPVNQTGIEAVADDSAVENNTTSAGKESKEKEPAAASGIVRQKETGDGGMGGEISKEEQLETTLEVRTDGKPETRSKATSIRKRQKRSAPITKPATTKPAEAADAGTPEPASPTSGDGKDNAVEKLASTTFGTIRVATPVDKTFSAHKKASTLLRKVDRTKNQKLDHGMVKEAKKDAANEKDHHHHHVGHHDKEHHEKDKSHHQETGLHEEPHTKKKQKKKSAAVEGEPGTTGKDDESKLAKTSLVSKMKKKASKLLLRTK